jgi:BirA family biotin operon repressor/biotin-[acetyl-CoA-carboxylase] ligase
LNHFKLIKIDATPSTSSLLREMHAQKLLSGPTIVWAKHQTQGRGQRDRAWISPPGENITLSVYSPLEGFRAQDAARLNMAASMLLIDWLAALDLPDLCVKWPNDILSGGKKIAGILIENFISGDSLRATVMGLGINVNQTAFESLPQAQSLQLITGQVYDLEPLVAQLIERLVGFFDTAVFEDPQLHARYESRLFRKGERSAFIYDGQQFEGELQGVSADGGCLIVREGQLVKYDTVLLKWLY